MTEFRNPCLKLLAGYPDAHPYLKQWSLTSIQYPPGKKRSTISLAWTDLDSTAVVSPRCFNS